jgi:hypothetical protein
MTEMDHIGMRPPIPEQAVIERQVWWVVNVIRPRDHGSHQPASFMAEGIYDLMIHATCICSEGQDEYRSHRLSR